ncbi:Hypothetical protein, putative [Bodo saltans]|uniref:Uncharacterized protein n=1 Tax=Bodo saltans TaxID=75058 RepID=A0A0S4JGZ9_BODSA|nr:Hypothetical protein, putative [Bodo saltans]|eukprot:CUG88270.1 Hypothetical protein, putative [Bodo saltans]
MKENTMKRIRVDSSYVAADDYGRVATWELCPESCPILTYSDREGDIVIAAIDYRGRSRCREDQYYTLKSFVQRQTTVSSSHQSDDVHQPTSASPSPKKGRSDAAVATLASTRKQRPATRYQQFMKLYLTAENNGGFKMGASKWTAISVEDRQSQSIDELVKRALR